MSLLVRIWGICSHVPWRFCVCLLSCSGGVCCFQFRLSCVHVVGSYAQSQCCVITIRLFPGLAGFPSPPSFTPHLLIPALCLICIMINSHTLCKAQDILSLTNPMFILLTITLTCTLDRSVCLYHVITNNTNPLYFIAFPSFRISAVVF